MDEKEKNDLIDSFITFDEVFITKLNKIYNNIENIVNQIKNETFQFISKFEDKDDEDIYILVAHKVKELKEKYLKIFVKVDENPPEQGVEKTASPQKPIFFEEISE